MFILFGVLAGICLPIQTSINAKLRKRVGTPYNASLISFIIGLLFLILLLIITGQGLSILFKKFFEGPLWIWFGGIQVGLYILANVILFGKIGTGMTVIILLIGATTGGLLVDNFGLFGSNKKLMQLSSEELSLRY